LHGSVLRVGFEVNQKPSSNFRSNHRSQRCVVILPFSFCQVEGKDPTFSSFFTSCARNVLDRKNDVMDAHECTVCCQHVIRDHRRAVVLECCGSSREACLFQQFVASSSACSVCSVPTSVITADVVELRFSSTNNGTVYHTVLPFRSEAIDVKMVAFRIPRVA
jgi:hypothetical protein